MLDAEVEGLAEDGEVGGEGAEAVEAADVDADRSRQPGGGLEVAEHVLEPARGLGRLGLDAPQVGEDRGVGGAEVLARPLGRLADVEEPGAEAVAEVAGDPAALLQRAAPRRRGRSSIAAPSAGPSAAANSRARARARSPTCPGVRFIP